jgi:hypothetical protein
VDGIGNADLAAARDVVLAAVRGALGNGGLSLRPPDVYTDWPMSPLYTLFAKHHAGQRFTAPERDTWHDARVWRSNPAWLAMHGQTRERALVFVVVDVVEGIAGSVTWRSPYLDEHRIRLALGTELDEIDAQLRQIAGARASRPGDPVAEQAWGASVERVSALHNYAGQLAILSGQLGLAVASGRADAHAPQLLSGAVRDEYATGRTGELSQDLAQTTASITQTLAAMRPNLQIGPM